MIKVQMPMTKVLMACGLVGDNTLVRLPPGVRRLGSATDWTLVTRQPARDGPAWRLDPGRALDLDLGQEHLAVTLD